MDTALALIESGLAFEGTDHLMHTLAKCRQTLGVGRWPVFAKEVVTHRIRDYMYADPFTFRAFSKPRGYAGDAVMMDQIYGLKEERLDAPIADIFRYTTGAAMARSVRARRVALADSIDEVATELGRDIEVVAVASGHLREIELSAAAARGQAHITALDADAESLAVVTGAYGHLGAVAQHGSVRQILSGKVSMRRADLIYSAGLYDYLVTPIAAALTAKLFAALRPGGRLLLANFLPGIPEVGYMESFMDWHLIYRCDADMLDLIRTLSRADVAAMRQFHDPHDNITYLELTRR
jgi:extracellular factor (EF) 3-hydroxypalmitic acid methyl ester biosynthesis protein